MHLKKKKLWDGCHYCNW